jgi:hypothetical protein
MLIIDTVSLGDARTTADGYMVADAKIARTGIQQYSGAEMGRPDLSVVRVFRPEAEVFHADALASMAHRPITVNHPTEAVTAANWKRHSVGQTGGDVARDGDYVRVPLVLMDQKAIDAVKGGKRQLSVGYSAEIDWTAGQTADGQSYDAVQRTVRGNHLAIVDQARAGPACRIGDGWSAPQEVGDRDMPDLKKITLDGLTIEVTDQGYEAIIKLQKAITDGDAAKAKAEKDLADAVTAHATAIGTKDGEIAGLRKQIPDAAALDKLVSDRAALVDGARKVLGTTYDPAGKSAADIKRAVATKAFGDESVKDQADAYVDGLFAAALKSAGGASVDPLRKVLGDGTRTADASAAAYEKSVADLNAWRTKTA